MHSLSITKTPPVDEVVASNPIVETSVAQAVLSTVTREQGPQIYTGNWYVCCSLAETRLQDSLKPDFINSTDQPSPILFTYNNSLVAVRKTIMERTVYALKTVPEINLIEGCFYVAQGNELPGSYERPSAFVQEVSHETTFLFRRPSALLIPIAERRALKAAAVDKYERRTMNIRHDKILSAAEAALETAVAV